VIEDRNLRVLFGNVFPVQKDFHVALYLAQNFSVCNTRKPPVVLHIEFR
jgi:hypothetical protein